MLVGISISIEKKTRVSYTKLTVRIIIFDFILSDNVFEIIQAIYYFQYIFDLDAKLAWHM